MAWAKLDDQFWMHRKVVPLSDGAFRLYVCALAYVQQQRTSGVLTEQDVQALSRLHRIKPKAASELTASGLWEDTDKGWRIHDWDQYNGRQHDDSRERVARYRARHRNGSVTDGNALHVTDGNGLSRAQTRSRVPDPDPDITNPNPDNWGSPDGTLPAPQATKKRPNGLTDEEAEMVRR